MLLHQHATYHPWHPFQYFKAMSDTTSIQKTTQCLRATTITFHNKFWTFAFHNQIYLQNDYSTPTWDITAENMEKSQHSDVNKDTTNESANVASSNVRLWKLDTQKQWRNTSWHFWEERAEKLSGFHGQQRQQMSGFLTKLE